MDKRGTLDQEDPDMHEPGQVPTNSATHGPGPGDIRVTCSIEL